jgi:hypothetical protein
MNLKEARQRINATCGHKGCAERAGVSHNQYDLAGLSDRALRTLDLRVHEELIRRGIYKTW